MGGTDPQIIDALMRLVQTKELFLVDAASEHTPALDDLLALRSPDGERMRNRGLNVSVPLTEAFALADDPLVRERLVNLTRWGSSGEIRAIALAALAGVHDPEHYDVFHEALLSADPIVRSGALDALLLWGRPQLSLPLFTQTAQADAAHILRVFAAMALVRSGDASGLSRLRTHLDSPSWLIRAAAGRALGEYGDEVDYDLLVSRLNREISDDFVTGSYCIAALRIAESGRLRTGLAAGIDPRIVREILRLFQVPPEIQPAPDPSLRFLAGLSAGTGRELQAHLADLEILLLEGLTGVKDPVLAAEVERRARQGDRPRSRAAALTALGAARDPQHLPLFVEALSHPDIAVRFSALGSLIRLDDPGVMPHLAAFARAEPSPILQSCAAAEMWRRGDRYGRELLLRRIGDPDWVVRAVTIQRMGELGGMESYRELLSRLGAETHPVVRAEMCSALMRLHRASGR